MTTAVLFVYETADLFPVSLGGRRRRSGRRASRLASQRCQTCQGERLLRVRVPGKVMVKVGTSYALETSAPAASAQPCDLWQVPGGHAICRERRTCSTDRLVRGGGRRAVSRISLDELRDREFGATLQSGEDVPLGAARSAAHPATSAGSSRSSAKIRAASVQRSSGSSDGGAGRRVVDEVASNGTVSIGRADSLFTCLLISG